MVRDTFLLKINLKQKYLTPTVLRNATWNAVVILVLYMIFNFFSLVTLNYHLDENLDTRIRHEVEHLYLSVKYENSELHILNQTELMESDLAQMTENPFFLQVFDLKGKILLESENLKLFQPIPKNIPEFDTEYYFEDIELEKVNLRTGYCKIKNEKNEFVALLQVSAIHNAVNELTESMIYFNIISFPIVIIVIVLVSIFLANRGIKRIRKIINLANEISATHISNRIEFDTNSDDELGKLKDTLNSLFDRLEDQIDQISDFSDNASHQLMTPLTAINSELDYLLRDKRSNDETHDSLKILKKQTQSMIKIISTLLILAKECNECSNKKSVFDASALIKSDLLNTFKGKKLKLNIDEEIFVRGKAEYFLMVVSNLLDNAFKYSKDQEVLLSFHKNSSQSILKVIDSGIGIPENEKELIFQRFFRGKTIGNFEAKGTGLGLSLVHSIITSMDGKILIEDNKPEGTIFSLIIPLVEVS